MLYFNITEETANVINILEMTKNGFETDDLILAQANGLRMEDNAVTRGNYPILDRFDIILVFIRLYLAYLY